MKQYLDLLQRILDEGCEKESGRPNMPHVWGIEDGDIKIDLRNGFPLLTTKKMPWKMIVHELLWFLHGDAYRWYQKICKDREVEPYFKTIEHFIEAIKNLPDEYISEKGSYNLGDLGKIYGYQWRNQNGIDQIKNLIEGLKKNPYSRYHILNAWNAIDFKDMALPPCHLLYQFIVRPLSREEILTYINTYCLMYDEHPWNINVFDNPDTMESMIEQNDVPRFYLNLNMYQRSCDFALGVPVNIASMSLLLMIIAKTCNMIPKQSKWIGGDIHMYLDHVEGLKEQLTRKRYPLPQLHINKKLNTLEDILSLNINDFELINYQSNPKIDFELFVGLK